MKKKEKKPTPPKSKQKKDPSENKKVPKILFLLLPVVLLLAVASVVLFMMFFRDGEEDTVNNLASYILGTDEVVSLESVVDEGTVTRTSVETPTEVGPQVWTYHYRQVSGTPSQLAASYLDILRGEEQGFILTDGEHRELLEEPNMEQTVGSVILAKEPAVGETEEDGDKTDAAADGEGQPEEQLLQVVLAWSEQAIAVQLSHQEGTILPPIVEEEETPGSQPREPIALNAQLEFFGNLYPGDLGLPGDNMSEYKVYPGDGWVRVNGVTCRVLNVYVTDLPEETNSFMGTYYLSSDNQELFKLDSNGLIVNVDFQ